MGKNMEKGLCNMLMELLIREIGIMIDNMAMELSQALKETNIEDNIIMVFKKVKDILNRAIVISMMGLGKMDTLTVRENQLLENKLLKVNFYKGSLMGNVKLLLLMVLLFKYNLLMES
jgi:hypothetical protein